MGEIHEALRRANWSANEPAPTTPRERQQDPEILETFRALAPSPPASPREPADVVAVSPDKRGRWQSRELVVDARGPASEAVRHLAIRVRRELEARSARSLVICSALREEGKTTMACNLALALASLEAGRRVALVDLDLRRPSVAASFEIRGRVGIEDVLAGRAALRDACVGLDVPALDVYPALRAQSEAHLLLSQPAFATALRELERDYELVVIDTPPVLLLPDAALVLGPVRAALAVGRAGRSTQGAIREMRKLLPEDRLIGAVLNEGSLPVRAKNYGYYAPEAEADPAT